MNDEIEDRLKAKISGSGFSMPDQYFDELNEKIRMRAKLEEIKDLTGEGGFTVPPLYFEQLTDRIQVKTSRSNLTQQGTKLIRLWHSDLFKYASAACFIFVTAFGLYLGNQQHKSNTDRAEIANEQALFDVDEQGIIDQIQTKGTATTNASQQEIEDYILNNYSQNDIASNL